MLIVKSSLSDHLQHIRHTLAHLLAASVIELYPGAQNAIGPAIEDGFYQDFYVPVTISDKDLAAVEKKMREKLKAWQKLHTSEMQTVTVDEARKQFAWNTYKTELINDFSKESKEITFSLTGDFLDLCKGGHAEDLSQIKPDIFKLDRIAGAYWKGDEKNIMLTRIYGLAFETKEKLKQHLFMLEEAKKRDHRKLGKDLDLFTFSDLVGPGLPLWTPKGTILREELNNFVWELRREKGYEKVTVPHITRRSLYETSGHWAKFADGLFKIVTREKHEYAMKPMNCPHHTQIFNHLQRSYRDMPQRYAETTMVYRDEQSGELSGLSRVLCITQDDAHVFCRYNQVKEEFFKIWDMVTRFYSTFGFTLRARLSLHDPKEMKNYLGTPEVWQSAEDALRDIAKERGADYYEGVGEAAMYGPKIDFMANDSIGRQWQVATIQLDMNLPERFDLFCVNEKGEHERIVMIHAAIMGSIERFASVLIEHLAGAFPVWLSPVQVAVIPVGEDFTAAGGALHKLLVDAGIRTEHRDANESVGYKIRQAAKEKIPYMIVIGEREAPKGHAWSPSSDLSVRVRGQEELLSITLGEFLKRIQAESKERRSAA